MAVGLRDGCSRQNGPCYAQWRRERPPTPTRRWSLRTLEHDTLERFGTSVGVRIDPAATMHARAAGMRMACSMQLHACKCRGAARGYEYSCIIQLYRTRVHRADICKAPHCVFVCPSQLVYVLQIPKKRAEAHLKQLEFALSTGHLGPKLPKQQLIPVLPKLQSRIWR